MFGSADRKKKKSTLIFVFNLKSVPDIVRILQGTRILLENAENQFLYHQNQLHPNHDDTHIQPDKGC